MENGIAFPRKYFVVVAHSPASQLELEAILSNGQYNSFGTSQAKMFIEGVDTPSSAPNLMESLSEHVSRISPPVNKHDTQLILSALESEWLRFQPAGKFNGITPPADEPDSSTTKAAKAPMQYAETWQLSYGSNTLVKDDVEVVLTGLEATLIKTMLQHEERVVSKDDLIRSIGREPEQYQGLEMCLSRLQDKFRSASNGERLFRAVRNRGYCLIQKITRDRKFA